MKTLSTLPSSSSKLNATQNGGYKEEIELIMKEREAYFMWAARMWLWGGQYEASCHQLSIKRSWNGMKQIWRG